MNLLDTAENVISSASSFDVHTFKLHYPTFDLSVADEADSNPHYKQAVTNNNILHVLSRLQLDPQVRLDRLVKFIGRGTCPSDYNKNGDLPLTLFATQGLDKEPYVETILKALESRGLGGLHMRNRMGETALHCACVGGHHFIASVLINGGSNVNSMNCKYSLAK